MRISDWSSDVCSSDLPGEGLLPSLNGTSPPLTSLACGRGIFGDYSVTKAAILIEPGKPLVIAEVVVDKPGPHEVRIRTVARSEARRVGKAGVSTCRFRWAPYH